MILIRSTSKDSSGLTGITKSVLLRGRLRGRRAATAAAIPHEGDCENAFSLGGRISDPNLEPSVLAMFVRISKNAKNYKPPVEEIKKLYVRKFSKNGGDWDDDDEF